MSKGKPHSRTVSVTVVDCFVVGKSSKNSKKKDTKEKEKEREKEFLEEAEEMKSALTEGGGDDGNVDRHSIL
jgi:hypothetical protein